MNNAFLVSLFEHKTWANRGALAMLASVPEDQRTANWIIALFTFDHTLIVDQVFKARLTGETPAFEAVVGRSMPDLDQLAETVEATGCWYADYARDVSQAELDEVIGFTFIIDGEAGAMTRGEMLAHVTTHSASHRGEIGALLKGLPKQGASDMVTSYLRAKMGGADVGPGAAAAP